MTIKYHSEFDVNPTIVQIHDALTRANVAYSGYSCDGVNLVGDRKSIDAAMHAFHDATNIPALKARIIELEAEADALDDRLVKAHDEIAKLKEICTRSLIRNYLGGSYEY